MTDTMTDVDRGQIASDFRTLFEGQLPEHTIDQAVAHLQAAPAASGGTYPAKGNLASLILWTKCQCYIDGGKTFDGSSWGIAVPGGGALIGAVITSDLEALYARTRSFALAATSFYTSFVFMDGDGHALGTFQAGSISTVTGTGGGSGSWS